MTLEDNNLPDSRANGLKLKTSTLILVVTAVFLLCAVAAVKFSRTTTITASISPAVTETTPIRREAQIVETPPNTNVAISSTQPSGTQNTTPQPNSTLANTPLKPNSLSNMKDESGKGYAVVIMENANLRYSPTVESSSIREVSFGEKLKIIGKPVGPWFKVYDSTTRNEGWLHGNTLKIQ